MDTAKRTKDDFMLGLLLGLVLGLVFSILLAGGAMVYFAHQASKLTVAAADIKKTIEESHRKSDLLAERRMKELHDLLTARHAKAAGKAPAAAAAPDVDELEKFLNKTLGDYSKALGGEGQPQKVDLKKTLEELNEILGGAKKAQE
ncbi:MAG: hypothetical protein FJ279_03350 [Planctomycetes bacterium]|nr:hypothetical protein [Planctomycetota bacterium]MBM4079759.1 hypothetical protein [Planctomycetota bacterium]